VRQLVADCEDVEEVNRQLDKMWVVCARAAARRRAFAPTLHPRRPAPPAPPAAPRRGFSMGQRLIDEYLARTKTTRCADFREAADRVARVGLKMFLGVTATVTGWDAAGTACALVLDDNPLADFVELPPALAGLRYSTLLAGAVRGALEAVGISVAAEVARDAAAGDPVTELRLRLAAARPEAYPFKDDD
jgi:hypothetical protein